VVPPIFVASLIFLLYQFRNLAAAGGAPNFRCQHDACGCKHRGVVVSVEAATANGCNSWSVRIAVLMWMALSAPMARA